MAAKTASPAETSEHLTPAEEALIRIKPEDHGMSMPEVEKMINDLGLDVDIKSGASVGDARDQIIKALEAKIEEEAGAQADRRRNGNPRAADEANGSNEEEKVEDESFPEQTEEDLEQVHSSLEQEAVDVEEAVKNLSEHSQQELENYRRTGAKAAEIRARKERAQLCMIGVIAAAQMERNEIDAELAAGEVLNNSANAVLQGIRLFRSKGKTQKSLAEKDCRAIPAGKGAEDGKGQ